eukprot:528132-Prymnesium_polylepis.1
MSTTYVPGASDSTQSVGGGAPEPGRTVYPTAGAAGCTASFGGGAAAVAPLATIAAHVTWRSPRPRD